MTLRGQTKWDGGSKIKARGKDPKESQLPHTTPHRVRNK